MAIALVYVTTKDKKEAQKIGGMLVERKLAACANLINHMEAVFWWKGEIETGEECVLIAKTKESLILELTEAVHQAHSYECPCVVALPIIGGHPEFIRWVQDSTKEPGI